MKNTELTKIREEKKMTKGEFAKIIGVSAMLLGKYEKGTCQIPEDVAKKVMDAFAVAEIEVKKKTRKAARKAKEKVETAVQSDNAVATEIEVKKAVRKGKRKTKKTAEKVKEAVKESKAFNIIIESPLGGAISVADIAKKVPKNASNVYVRVDENKLYYVLDDEQTGDVDIWE